MRSFSKKNAVFFLIVTFALSCHHKLNAAQDTSNAHEAQGEQTIEAPHIKGFYPTYPVIKPSSDPKQTALVKRGEYVAKMGDCIACHTNVEEQTPAFSGRLPIATPFGTFYSPNITPDKKTGIGGWTEKEFAKAMRQGQSPHGGNYFPVFPYIYFSKITDQDIHALYAYFQAIPAVELENRPLPFPFNIPGARLSLWGWNMLFFFAENNPIIYDKSKSEAWNRGRYIVDGLGHCGMCHTPLSLFGAPKNRYYLTGSFIDGYWAPNISKLGLAGINNEEITHVFSKNELINQAGPVAGPMAEVNHNSLGYLNPEDSVAIATYLKTVVSDESVQVPSYQGKATLRRGKQVYLNSCTLCHQNGMVGAPLIGDSANWYRRLTNSGLNGLYRHAIAGLNNMPIKGACVTCNDEDIIAATNYILNHSLSRAQWYHLNHADNEQPNTEKVGDIHAN